jgi:uracil phosphoribosyltransferase
MIAMINSLISILKNRETSLSLYRETTEKLGCLLAAQAAEHLRKEIFTFKTPLEETEGSRFTQDIVIIPILRSGLALLPSFLRYFPGAKVGFVGMKRDEHTALPTNTYQHFPSISKNSEILVLEPMIATGGSISATIDILLNKGAQQENIIVTGVLAAPEGLDSLKKYFPKIRVVVGKVDLGLNSSKFIFPGLGDFGDRYFGTS